MTRGFHLKGACTRACQCRRTGADQERCCFQCRVLFMNALQQQLCTTALHLWVNSLITGLSAGRPFSQSQGKNQIPLSFYT